jgi:hypothetical protein
VLGLDVARGLAVLGMFGAHLGAPDDFLLAEPATWGAIVHGRSSILFAVLAGVSLSLLSRDRTGGSGGSGGGVGGVRAGVRVRITVRALIIFAIGVLLTALGTPIAVILEYYALMFVLALPLLGARARTLFVLAGAWALVSPVIVLLLGTVASAYGAPADDLLLRLLVTGSYPVIAWMSFLWFGMGLGRLDLTSVRVGSTLLGIGVGLALLGYGAGMATAAPDAADVSATFGGPTAPDWGALLGVDAHSGTTFEIVGSSGVAAAVIGSCLLVASRLRPVLFPVESVGATALSTYSAHVLAYAVLFPDEPSEWAWLWFAVVALVVCPLWRLTIGRGPLETLVHTVSVRAAEGRAVPPESTTVERERSER